MNASMDKSIHIFHFVSNPTPGVQKIRNQREVTLVHEHLLKDSLNEFHSTVLLVNFLDLKLWGREGICSLPIGAINKPNLYSSVCSLE